MFFTLNIQISLVLKEIEMYEQFNDLLQSNVHSKLRQKQGKTSNN